jgi:hypothetical protein
MPTVELEYEKELKYNGLLSIKITSSDDNAIFPDRVSTKGKQCTLQLEVNNISSHQNVFLTGVNLYIKVHTSSKVWRLERADEMWYTLTGENASEPVNIGSLYAGRPKKGEFYFKVIEFGSTGEVRDTVFPITVTIDPAYRYNVRQPETSEQEIEAHQLLIQHTYQ